MIHTIILFFKKKKFPVDSGLYNEFSDYKKHLDSFLAFLVFFLNQNVRTTINF